MAAVSSQVTRFFTLAARCKVSIYAACKETGISQSLPYRWRNGEHQPRLDKIEALEGAVLKLAKERGTLPEGIRSASDVE